MAFVRFAGLNVICFPVPLGTDYRKSTATLNFNQEESCVTLDPDGFFGRVCEALEIKPGRGAKAKIADKLKINKSSVGLWEQGDMPGLKSLSNVVEVSKLSNASLHWLLTGEGQKKIEPHSKGLDFTGTERQLIQRLAEEVGISFEGMVHELVLDALFRKGADWLANRGSVDPSDLRSLKLLFKLLPVETSSAEGVEDTPRALKRS